jgi:hypothetical protein
LSKTDINDPNQLKTQLLPLKISYLIVLGYRQPFRQNIR